MKAEFKPKRYEVGCSGSGWGVWEISTGNKVEGFGLYNSGRLKALEAMYILNGWNLPKYGFK